MEIHSETVDERVLCPFCNEVLEKGSRYCPHCGESLPGKSKKRFRRRYIVFGFLSIMVAGAIWFFAVGVPKSKLIGKVNGEGITRKEFLTKVDRMKKFYGSRYGENLFQGEAGKENFTRLKTEILDEMIEEKLILQEARNAGYASASVEEIEKRLETIRKENGLSDADLVKMFGGTIEDLKAEIGKGWVISQFIEKTVLKNDQANGNVLFGQWLSQAKAKSKIVSYEKWESVAAAKASCCTSGCGGGGKIQPLDPKIDKEAKAKALEYYEKKTQKKGAEARVTNFGCHIQVDIIEAGKVVVSLTYRGGEVEEI